MKYFKDSIAGLLSGFEYEGLPDFMHSLLPTLKYNLVILVISLSALAAVVDKLFGLDAIAVLALLVIMILEVASGTYASKISKQEFSSKRLSRFTFKVACYLVLISAPYLFYVSYKSRGNMLVAGVFEWLHVFLVVQIVIENVLSILENVAIIQGKPKTYWIEKIKSKVNIL